MDKISDAELANWFTYHPPQPDQVPKYVRLRDKALELAELIRDLCPAAADTTAAIRKLREAVMTANAAIACERPPEDRGVTGR